MEESEVASETREPVLILRAISLRNMILVENLGSNSSSSLKNHGVKEFVASVSAVRAVAVVVVFSHEEHDGRLSGEGALLGVGTENSSTSRVQRFIAVSTTIRGDPVDVARLVFLVNVMKWKLIDETSSLNMENLVLVDSLESRRFDDGFEFLSFLQFVDCFFEALDHLRVKVLAFFR